MAGMTVEVRGARELDRSLHAAARKLLNQTEPNRVAGQQLVTTAMGRAPRRTGRLAGSITTLRADGVTVQVGSTVRYASYVNYGSRHNRPTYFLTGALDSLTTDAYAAYADQCLAIVKGV